jgi:hypothetical protein
MLGRSRFGLVSIAERVECMNASPAEGVQASPEAINAIVKASEAYAIFASQDIVDVRGLKLWAKGQPVSSALQQRLLDRKLQHPLEACLAVEDGVTVASLRSDLSAYLEEGTPLAAALRPWTPQLLQQVKQIPLHSVAQLLLTTALATRPNTLPHAVIAMALAGAMASAQRSVVDVRQAMLGGLLHDIGEVYIQPQYLNPCVALDLVGHKHLAVHPRVAQMLLSTSTDYPESLCRAIGEHHERLDGSGYPARLGSEKISPLGRLLGVVEVMLGLMRSPRAPLIRASFALRIVPGEFDPVWSNLVCNIARSAGEIFSSPADAASADDAQDVPLDQIDQRLAQAQLIKATLKNQAVGGLSLEIAEAALYRLGRLRVAWNALGFWGVDVAELDPLEAFQLNLTGKELQQRLGQLERECFLLSERLSDAERMILQPLWPNLMQELPG